MSKIRIGLQIESTSPSVRQLIGSGKGVSEWDGIDPDEIVKVTYTVESSDIQEINPGIYYNIPSITTAKQGDTLFSDDGRLFVYDEAGSRWFLWYTFDNSTAKIHTNNTLKGEGTLDDPLTVNATVVALKGDLNPLLEGTDNGDGTYTFTSVDGNTSFTIDPAAISPVQSVNGQTGTVILDPDDLDDTSTTNKFVTQGEKDDIASAVQPGDLGTAAAADIGDFATAAQGSLADTALQPGDNISDLNNDSGFVNAAGAASAAPVQSVNSQIGAVVLDADDIDDTATINKFVTAAEKSDIASAVQPGDLATVATTGAYSDLTGTPTIPNSLDDLSGDSDDISEGTTNLFMTSLERSKLAGIASGAEVNVNADWNAVSGDAQILNKPTLGTAAAADIGDFATAAQGSLADSATQPTDTDVSLNAWVLDEDTMVSDDATKVPTQQSVKAYVDTQKTTVNNPTYGFQVLTDAANISWDMDLGEIAKVTITDNRTIDNPTNLKTGTYVLFVIQDGVGGHTLSFDTDFKWKGGIAPTITAAANAVDILTFVSDGTFLYGAITNDYS